MYCNLYTYVLHIRMVFVDSGCEPVYVPALHRFAVKCLDKRRIKLKKCEAVAFNERDILSRLNSPFIVNLHYCFHSATTIYHVLDLMTGTYESLTSTVK